MTQITLSCQLLNIINNLQGFFVCNLYASGSTAELIISGTSFLYLIYKNTDLTEQIS